MRAERRVAYRSRLSRRRRRAAVGRRLPRSDRALRVLVRDDDAETVEPAARDQKRRVGPHARLSLARQRHREHLVPLARAPQGRAGAHRAAADQHPDHDDAGAQARCAGRSHGRTPCGWRSTRASRAKACGTRSGSAVRRSTSPPSAATRCIRRTSRTWPGSTTRRTQLALYPGRYEPPSARRRGPMQVPYGERWRLACDVQQRLHLQGRPRRLRGRRPGLRAAAARPRDARRLPRRAVDIRRGTAGPTPPRNVVLARQNLPLIVDRRPAEPEPERRAGVGRDARQRDPGCGARASASTGAAT